MKMNQKGKGNDYFETPQYIFDQLNKVFNFEMDLACTIENKKCELYYDENINALCQTWTKRSFCNPPFSQKAEFIKKAHDEVSHGTCPICVMILPLNSMDTKAWHEYIENKFYYEVLRGRIAFIDPETKKKKTGNNSGTVIVYFKKKVEV